MTLDRKEIYRYLGYRRQQPDPEVEKAVEECLKKLQPLITLRETHLFFPLEWIDTEVLRIQGMEIRSHSLARNLKGCSEVCLMAATVGFGPDRLSERAAAAGKMSQAVILQAVGTAWIEAWGDEVNEAIRKEAADRNLFARPRFSPGYGDFALDFQTQFFQMLSVSKKIGVTLTESLLMLPSKSITALIGFSETDTHCVLQGCADCTRAQVCSYRR